MSVSPMPRAAHLLVKTVAERIISQYSIASDELKKKTSQAAQIQYVV